MYIRHLVGPRKGETEDVIFDRARAKILAGEAEDVYGQLREKPKVVSIESGPEISASDSIKKKTGKFARRGF